jgi:protein-arginine kinase activator protein McsA
VERLKLLELTEIQNARLQDERNAHSKTQNFLRMEKQKCAKLEANFARLQLEQTSSRSGYSTSRGNTPKQIEYDIKDKLELAEENVKALTTRLEIETFERKHDLQEFTKILKNYE